MPTMKFYEAIQDAYLQTMRNDPEVYIIGVGVIDPKAVFGSVTGLLEEFGEDRVVEGPLAEQMLTGFAFASATLGMKPVLIHHRVDFLPLTMDQIVNHCAKWSYMFGGQQKVPMVIRGIVGRGWGNGPQHTQSLHSLMANVPGLKVVVPSNPADAKGLMISAIMDNEPVIYIDPRSLHNDSDEVPEGIYQVPIGKAKILRGGNDLTLVAIGPMVKEALIASQEFCERGYSIEVIDLHTIRPLDYTTVIKSVKKTGNLIIADADWPYFGVSAALISQISQHAFGALKRAPKVISWPDHPVPASYMLDKDYYPTAAKIVNAISEFLSKKMTIKMEKRNQETHSGVVHGPF